MEDFLPRRMRRSTTQSFREQELQAADDALTALAQGRAVGSDQLPQALSEALASWAQDSAQEAERVAALPAAVRKSALTGQKNAQAPTAAHVQSVPSVKPLARPASSVAAGPSPSSVLSSPSSTAFDPVDRPWWARGITVAAAAATLAAVTTSLMMNSPEEPATNSTQAQAAQPAVILDPAEVAPVLLLVDEQIDAAQRAAESGDIEEASEILMKASRDLGTAQPAAAQGQQQEQAQSLKQRMDELAKQYPDLREAVESSILMDSLGGNPSPNTTEGTVPEVVGGGVRGGNVEGPVTTTTVSEGPDGSTTTFEIVVPEDGEPETITFTDPGEQPDLEAPSTSDGDAAVPQDQDRGRMLDVAQSARD